jgi:hypothetical protein
MWHAAACVSIPVHPHVSFDHYKPGTHRQCLKSIPTRLPVPPDSAPRTNPTRTANKLQSNVCCCRPRYRHWVACLYSRRCGSVCDDHATAGAAALAGLALAPLQGAHAPAEHSRCRTARQVGAQPAGAAATGTSNQAGVFTCARAGVVRAGPPRPVTARGAHPRAAGHHTTAHEHSLRLCRSRSSSRPGQPSPRTTRTQSPPPGWTGRGSWSRTWACWRGSSRTGTGTRSARAHPHIIGCAGRQD